VFQEDENAFCSRFAESIGVTAFDSLQPVISENAKRVGDDPHGRESVTSAAEDYQERRGG
jgi:hypothetical protein